MFTQEEFNKLTLASDYASNVYLKHQALADEFLQQFPLNATLNHDDIRKFIHHQNLANNQLITTTNPNTTIVDFDFFTHTTDSLKQHLRISRALLMMRWIWQDALNQISVEQLTYELSCFADICILMAQEYSYYHLYIKYGIPSTKHKNNKPTPVPFFSIAMGKLGAQELNLSSDIDLVFVYAKHGQTDIDAKPIDSRLSTDGEDNCTKKSIENQRFFTLLSQKIIQLLDQKTADGFVFRVDMRLRPWGDGSDIACHFKTLANYFLNHGRDWERFAWLKARIIHADTHTKEITELNKLIHHFVFRHYVDYTAFSALREMKTLIQSQQKQRQDEDNVKLGAGGIRDIEFIVQSYQIIHAGSKPELQVKNCLSALQQLVNYGFITEAIGQDLKEAYLFLRKVEHALQAVEDRQTQTLPKKQPLQQRLANTLGFLNWQEFTSHLNAHKEIVTKQFNLLVQDRQQADFLKHEAENINNQIHPDVEKKLADFLTSSAVTKLSSQNKKRLDTVWQDIVRVIARSTNQEIACTRLLAFLESILNRSIYLVLLKENPDGLLHLMQMMEASPWIANEISRYPVLLDEFLLNRKKPLPTKQDLVDQLRQKLLRIEPDDEEAQLACIRIFKKSVLLHVSSKDILANQTLMTVSDTLTWTAEAVLHHVLALCYASLVKKHGLPTIKSATTQSNQPNACQTDTNQPFNMQACGFGIIGYGKLGGIELSYGSDLDLVFLHNIDESTLTNGDKPISGLRFVNRLAKKIITYLSTHTRDGRAYEIDMRLRPSGNSGIMVSNLASFANYQENQAWLWEYQALVRARGICGDALVLNSFSDIRKNIITHDRDSLKTLQEVTDMRTKMYEHLGVENKADSENQFHIKHDLGGIVDIEFLVQYFILINAHQNPDICTYTDNVRLLEALVNIQAISQEDGNTLTNNYLTLRNLSHHLVLAEKKSIVVASDWEAIRATTKALWSKYMINDG